MPAPSLFDFLRDAESWRGMRQGLTDAANRGMVAGTLGAPVDMATQAANLGIAGVGYLGHKTGLLSAPPELLDSRNVPGSSEWIGQKMQDAGMVSANRNPVAEMGMGLLSPAAFKAAQKAGGLLAAAELKAAENAAKPSTLRMAGQRGVARIGGMADDVASYQGGHKPMRVADGAAPLHDLTKVLPEDFYSPSGLSYYGSGDDRERTIFKILKQVRNQPDALVTIYRGVPDGVGQKINPGDWVTLSPEYASDYGRVVSAKVPARHLSANGDSLLEQGYFPD